MGLKKAAYYRQVLESVARHYGFDMNTPFKKLSKEARDSILNGTGDVEIEFHYEKENRSYKFTEPFEGVIGNLERRYRETESHDIRDEIERFMNSQPCPECNGARLKKEALFIKVGGKNISELVGMSIKGALDFFQALELKETDELIARRILKEVSERLGFLINVGLDYITLDRAAANTFGRRRPTHKASHPDRL